MTPNKIKQSGIKILVIGWDGATWKYIDPLLAQGGLPNFGQLLTSGARATLRSTIPPFTNIAWPSLITGRGPAKTGVFDGARTKPDSYAAVPTNLTGYRGIPLWHWANRFGRRAGVLNVPMTYPAAELAGYLVSGFDSPHGAADVAYPRDILARWAAQGYTYRILDEEIDLMARQNPHHPRSDVDRFVSRWVDLTEEQGELVAWLWQHEPVDLMFVVFSGTDSVNHRTRDFTQISRVYRAADRALGRILEQLGEQALICLVSDHGSTPAHRYIALYRALHDAGWIAFQPQVAGRFWKRLPGALRAEAAALWQQLPAPLKRVLSWPLLRIDDRLGAAYDNIEWRQTQVFARSGMGPLYINLAGRQPEGCVPSNDYEPLRDEIIRYFRSLRDDEDRLLFKRVWQREELYPGARPADRPPDLVFEPARWTDHVITGYPSDPLVRPIPAEREYGAHTPDGVLVLAGPGVRCGADIGTASIVDVFPTLLAAWQLPVPAETDGQVLQAAFSAPLKVQRVVAGTGERRTHVGAEAESEEVLERLRALGYLE